MKYEVVNLDQMVVVGTSIYTTNKNGKAMEDIGKLWEKFIVEGISEKIGNKKNQKCIGLYTEFEMETESYKFLCGSEVAKAEENDLETTIIEAGKYAKFTIHGDVKQAVGEAWQKIWELNLDRKFSYDFEVYHNNSDDMTNQMIDIYIALN